MEKELRNEIQYIIEFAEIHRVIPLQQFMDSVVDRHQWLTKNSTVQVSPLVWIDFTSFSAYIVIYKIYIPKHLKIYKVRTRPC